MRRYFIWSYAFLSFLGLLVVMYMVGEYLYLRWNFEVIDREVKEYEDIPYLSRKLSMLESEVNRIKTLEKEISTPALVLGRIVNIFFKNDVKVSYITREVSEDNRGGYKASVKGNFNDVFRSLGEIESLFLPITLSKIYMQGSSENVNMVLHFEIME